MAMRACSTVPRSLCLLRSTSGGRHGLVPPSIWLARFASSLRQRVQVEAAYINGEPLPAYDSATFPVLNPATGAVIGHIPDMGKLETDEAVQAAYNKFPEWRDTPAKERGIILRRWASLIQQNREELGQILTAENGKPLAEAIGEVDYAASFVDFYSEEARRIHGDIIPSPTPNKKILLLKQPIGVSGMITPWNVPSAMVTRKVSPALAAGCTVVLRPADETPYSALALYNLAEEAGLPPGVLNVVTSSREKVGVIGQTLCEHPQVAHISFTGSTSVGKLLLHQAADTVKKVSLELGGNAAAIVFNSADVEKAVQNVMASKFRGMGQACICTNRIFVQEAVYDEFLAGFTAAMRDMRLGNGVDEGVTHGPLIHQRALNKVESLVDEAVSRGAKVVMGGKRHALGGNFFEPTLLTDVTPEMDCFKEEIFGPVAAVMKFKTEEEVVKLANDVNLGLAGYVYSSDISQIWRLVEKLEIGVMGVNEGMPTLAEGAFGGFKQSGLGREGSKYGIEDFLEIKYLCLGV